MRSGSDLLHGPLKSALRVKRKDFYNDHHTNICEIGVVCENAGARGDKDIIQRSDRQQQKTDRFILQKVPPTSKTIDTDDNADVSDNVSDSAKNTDRRLKRLCIVQKNTTTVHQSTGEQTPKSKIIDPPSDAKFANILNRGNIEDPIMIQSEGNLNLNTDIRGNDERPMTPTKKPAESCIVTTPERTKFQALVSKNYADDAESGNDARYCY